MRCCDSLHFGMIALLQLDPADSIARYQGGGAPKGAVMLVVLALLYALPTMLAWKRGSRRRWKITAINLLLGWTVIGWIVAMVMTFAYEPPADGEEPDREHVPGS
jgi:hypothetical protein